MPLHRISLTDLLTLISLPSAENCFPVVVFLNFFPRVNQSGAKKMTEKVLIAYCCCTIHWERRCTEQLCMLGMQEMWGFSPKPIVPGFALH